MKCEYYYRFNNIGYKIAIPNGLWHRARYDPQHGNHRERQGERDKERHAVVAVEFVDNHEHIDVAKEKLPVFRALIPRELEIVFNDNEAGLLAHSHRSP